MDSRSDGGNGCRPVAAVTALQQYGRASGITRLLMIGGQRTHRRRGRHAPVRVMLALSAIGELMAPTPAFGQLEPCPRGYEAVVHRYMGGDREGAVDEMAGWPEARTRTEIKRLAGLWRGDQPSLGCSGASARSHLVARAALMLHSDCAQRARRVGAPPQLHESLALEIARLLKGTRLSPQSVEATASDNFVRRWWGAMANLAQSESRWDDALSWAGRGLREFPDSAELLLVIGSIEETIGVRAQLSLPEIMTGPIARDTQAGILLRREARRHLEKAHRSLQSAVTADPGATEARLRVGRLAWRLGKTAEAREALRETLAQGPEAETAFLAHLFLGRLDEDAGRLDDASRSYQAALAIDADSQSARLALSHVRHRQGDLAGARAEALRLLTLAGRRRPDPFWLYPWGSSRAVEGRLDALRREASS